jgi:hypothetical protein
VQPPFACGYAFKGRLIENATQGDIAAEGDFTVINLIYKLMTVKLHGIRLKNSQFN